MRLSPGLVIWVALSATKIAHPSVRVTQGPQSSQAAVPWRPVWQTREGAPGD
jgi:hypothetical protein